MTGLCETFPRYKQHKQAFNFTEQKAFFSEFISSDTCVHLNP